MADQPSPSPDGPPRPDASPIAAACRPASCRGTCSSGCSSASPLVMVGILALSGPPAKPRATAAPSPAAVAVDPNQQRIEEYQRRIQEQAQRLAAEQAQLQLTKEALVGDAPTARRGATPRRSLAESSAPTASAPLGA